MGKKHIAFVIKNLKMGGTRVSLLSLIEAMLSTGSCDIDLIVISHVGPLMDRIPSCVCVRPENRWLKISLADRADLHGIDKLLRGLLYLAKRVFGYSHVYSMIYQNYSRRFFAEPYDLVVGYQEGETNDLSVTIPAKKHLIWYHTNYKTYHEYEIGRKIDNVFELADKIAFVTAESMKSFAYFNPEYGEKCQVIRNILPVNRIKELAIQDSENVFTGDGLRIVSVGRLSPEKGYERAVDIAERLVKEGFNFEWAIVGGGAELENLQKKVNSYGAGKNIRFLGERKNPYQIVRQADVFVLTSYTEAQPLVVLEGLILGKPFISTDFDSARETLPESCGFIVENSEDGIYRCLKKVLEDSSTLSIKQKLAEMYCYSNESVLQDIFSLL